MPKPIGHPGSWFATWNGEKLPCVHKICTDGQWPHYTDKGINDHAAWPSFIAAIREGKRVILTRSNLKPTGSADRRTGYIAVWSVDNVEVIGSELHFDLVDRIADFK